MHTINIHDAKTHFSRFVDIAAAGEEIIIAKAGKPTAILGPLPLKGVKRVFGSLKGQVRLANDFDAPLSEEVVALFEGN